MLNRVHAFSERWLSRPGSGYAFAIVATVFGAMLRWMLDPLLGELGRFIPLYLSVALVATLAGWRPGLVTLVAGGVVWFWLFIYLPSGRTLGTASQYPELVLYFFVGGIITILADWGRRGRIEVMKSRQRLQGIVRSAMDAIVTVDEQQRVVLFNPAAEQMFRCPADQAIGGPIDRFIPQRFRKAHREHIDRFGQSGKTMRGMGHLQPLSGLRADGHEFPIEASISQVHVGGHRLFTVILRDITEHQKAEQAVRESEERLRLSLRASDTGWWHWDFVTDVLDGDAKTKRLVGLPVDEPIQSFARVLERTHSEDWGRLQQRAADAKAGPGDYEVDFRTLWPDGSIHWILAKGQSFHTSEGDPLSMMGIVMDITPRKQAEEQLRMVAQFPAENPNPVFRVSHEGSLLYANPVAREKLTAMGWQADGPVPNVFILLVERALRSGKTIEQDVDCAEGRTFSFAVTPVADTGYVNFYGRDITARREAEWRLAAAQRNAENAKAAAEEANAAKTQFLANMSHELRTPMNAILGMTELALQEELSPVVRDSLQTAKDSADMLLTLINEILDMSRIEAGMLTLESSPFRLRALLDSTMRAIAVRGYEKGLEMACDVSPEVPDRLIGDSMRLRQVVTNLVANAIKFTEHGEIVVHVDLDEAGEGPSSPRPLAGEGEGARAVMLRFAVADTGIGIAQEHHQKIFAPFAQADASTTRRFGGTGLGLSIVSSLIEILGGRMWLESEVGLGSTFYFTIVLERQPGPEPIEPEQLVLEQLKNLPVLIAEDNATTRRVLQRILSGWSMQPVLAEDASSALAFLREAARAGHPSHLVIADAFMPGTDGMRLVEDIHQDTSIKAVVILMASPPEKQRLIRVAGSRNEFVYLEKPVSEFSLWCALSQAMGLSLCPDLLLAASPRTTAVAPQRLRILLAEDTPANQKLAYRILTKRGHEVEAAENGQEAVELLKRAAFDVVLMDVQMPTMDGFQATAAIRSMPPEKSRVPIVAMTAHALKGDRERCLAAGMDAYISKPINAGELIFMVESQASKAAASER